MEREWEAGEIGSTTGALQCKTEDSIPWKNPREPDALRACMKVWLWLDRQGVATWEQGYGKGWVWLSLKARNGVWVWKQENGISDLNLWNNILAAMWRTGWRGKTRGREINVGYHCCSLMSNMVTWMVMASGDEEKRMNVRTFGGVVLARLMIY